MVARLDSDKGISVLAGSQFNYGGERTSLITEEMAREVMDFTIEKRPCMTEDGLAIPRMNYLRRSDGGIVDAQCSVGEEFEVTCQPLETLEIAKFIMSKIPDVRMETVATMYNGGTSFITLTQGEAWGVRGDRSPHFTNVVLNNPLTRGRIHLVQSVIRVVCMNTLAAACKSGEGYRISHTKNARAMMERALKGMEFELNEAARTRQICEFLAGKQIGTAHVEALLDALYPLPEVVVNEDGTTKNARSLSLMKKRREDVMEQFEGDDTFTDRTFWSFFSANSYLMEHPRHRQERTDTAQLAFENMTGGKAVQKSEMLDVVYQAALAA